MRTLGITAALAGMPVAVLACLAAFQWATFWPALAGIALCTLTAGAFALVWGRDLDLLIDSVRRIASDDPRPTTGTPLTEAESAVMMNPVGREIERLSRRLAARFPRHRPRPHGRSR